jgi:hypothetical protein
MSPCYYKGREDNLVLRSKNAWSYTSIPQYTFMPCCLVKHRDNTDQYGDSCSLVGMKMSMHVELKKFTGPAFKDRGTECNECPEYCYLGAETL